MRLHHMGYVVRDIEPAMRGFVHSLQANWDNRIFDCHYSTEDFRFPWLQWIFQARGDAISKQSRRCGA